MSRRLSDFDALVAACAVPARGARRLIALAGPPASGKSPLAPRLADALGGAVVPMDGFHLDDTLLEPRGLLPRKGAPETFDQRGFARFIADLATGGEVFHPTFDRTREIAIAQSGVVPAECDTVVVEGNYLLLDAPGWRELAARWDLSVYLPVDPEVLEQRLIARWLGHGLPEQAARAKAMDNDIPNGARVAAALLDPDITYTDTLP